MADLGSFGRRRQPTAAEVVGRLKDDGDFDALRRAIVRKVKDNEVLRNNIITEVKQSMVLSEDGSEKMKLKELSDAIFQDVGSKIMGQISDEVWSVLQSSETDIQGSVEAVFDRIMNPEQQKDTGPSPKKLKRKGEQVSPAKASTPVSVQVEDDDPEEPPGFGLSDLQRSSTIVKQDQPCDDGHAQVKPNGGELVGAGSLGDADDEDPDVPPGFG